MLNTVTPVMNAIRTIFVTFDIVIYYLLKFVYELFFNIATFNLLDRKMIFDMFSRVQLIIGIFMLFQLAMTIIKGIVNPDSFTDSKSGGAGNVIMRIIVSLVLLALLVPLNISDPKNEYEKQINNNGVLFGTLYSLQYRILSNNTLGRIILGDDSTNYTSSDPDNDKLTKDANKFTSLIVKTFYQLNVDDEGKYVCNDGYDEVYYQEDVDPALIISQGAEPCSSINWIVDSAIDKTISNHVDNLDLRDLGDKYRLSFNWLSTIVGIILVILLFMIIFNVAKRAFLLAALQLLAPIPIISYMDPKGSKDSAFNSWLKLLGTTYLELFIQLAVIYFAFGVINSFIDRFDLVHLTSDMMNMQKNTYVSGPALLLWTYIILIIALFIFAKDAPKFFKQMLGIKDDGKGFFSTFGTAMGFGATAVAAIGSFNAGRSGSRLADLTNHDEQYANRFGNRAKHIAAGIVNMGRGLSAGSAAASESKGNGVAKTMAAWKAMNAINDETVQRGASGSTFIGRTGATGAKVFQGAGNTGFDQETRRIGQLKDIEKAGKDLFSYLEGKGKTDGADYVVETAAIDALGTGIDSNGNKVKIRIKDTINQYNRRKAAALANEQRTGAAADFEIVDQLGIKHTINAHDAVTVKIEEELSYAAGHKWAKVQDDKEAVTHDGDIGYLQKKDTYNESIKGANFEEGPELSQRYDTTGAPDTVDVSNLKKRFKKAGGMAIRHESDAAYKKQQKDFAATKKNG